MARKLKAALLLLMLALVPIRALAAVTTGVCPFAHEHGTEHAVQGHESHDHGDPGHSHSSCSSCVEHCASAAIVPSGPLATLIDAAAEERLVLEGRSVAGFIADRLDRPPLPR